MERTLKGLDTQHHIISSFLRGIAGVKNPDLVTRTLSLDFKIRVAMDDQNKIG